MREENEFMSVCVCCEKTTKQPLLVPLPVLIQHSFSIPHVVVIEAGRPRRVIAVAARLHHYQRQ